MAKVAFLPEQVAPPIDGKLEEVAAVAALAGKPVKLRLQPDFYDYDKRSYNGWVGLTWTLELEGVEEGRRFREGLAKFMGLFGDPDKQAEVLQCLQLLVDGDKGL